jgi:hypothetical protein
MHEFHNQYEVEKWLMETKPYERVRGGRGYNLDDDITGILIGFKEMYEIRCNWVDESTTEITRREIKALINREIDKALSNR